MDHIRDVERVFRSLAEAVRKNNGDLSSIHMTDVNDTLVGVLYDNINEKGFSSRTFNKYFSILTSFLSWYNDEYKTAIPNWFEKVNRREIHTNPDSITKEEFDALLTRITPENGIKKYEQGQKKERNLFRSWLADGFKLMLFTGRRREEATSLRWCDLEGDIYSNAIIKTRASST